MKCSRPYTAQKIKFFFKDSFSKCLQIPQFSPDFFPFINPFMTEAIII